MALNFDCIGRPKARLADRLGLQSMVLRLGFLNFCGLFEKKPTSPSNSTIPDLAFSMNGRVLFVGVLGIKALLVGVYLAPEF